MGRVDTVEWGGSEPARRRRLPGMRFAFPRTGTWTLAGLGFAALVASEFLPWGTAHVSSSAAAAAIARSMRYTLGDGQGVGLDRVQSADVPIYHLGVVLLLAAIGLGLAGAASRRRAAMGAALGVAAGTGLALASVYQSTMHYFDNFSVYFFDGPGPGPDAYPGMSVAPGVFTAVGGIILLAATAITAGLSPHALRRNDSVPAGAPESAGREDRELTVSALEPVDESYFARPESR